MRLRYLAFTFALIIGAPGNAWPQSVPSTSDNALQAAYCLGIIDEWAKEMSELSFTRAECSRWWSHDNVSGHKFESEKQCLASQELADWFTEHQRFIEQKRKRYHELCVVLTGHRSAAATESVIM
jgi:hypothetical protein